MADAESQTNTAAVYLMPLLAMLACSLISRAASDGGGFDALYPLRLFAVAGVAWAYRRHYRTIDWRFGWLGPAAGVAVFGMWILAQRWTTWIQPDGNGDAGAGLAAGLADLPHWSRMAWLAARSVAATITVPVAEELAFRGYLARRVMSADVESVSLRRLGAVALAVSSLAFGLMHGKMWIAGTLAGLVFALVARRRGRLGEAVAAHATANLLIAVWVLARGDYSLW
jgi:CAAX prenyl protease-like protein